MFLLCFRIAFIFHQLAFLCHFFFLRGFCVYYVFLCLLCRWLISSRASLCYGAFRFPSPAPLTFFLSVLHVFGPMSGSDVVGSARCSHCGLPVAPWDWQALGHTVQELQRLGPPASLQYKGAHSRIDCDGKALLFFLVQLLGFLLHFVCFLKAGLFPVSSTHAFPFKLGEFQIREKGVGARGTGSFVPALTLTQHLQDP